MTRKKDEDNSWLSIIVGVILVATPFAAIAIYFILKSRASDAIERFNKKQLIFKHRDLEIKEMGFLNHEIQSLERDLRKAIERGHGLGLSKNKDGSFSARSNAGKEIREQIAEGRDAIPLLKDQYEEILSRPLSNWNDLNFNMRSSIAARWGMLAWVLTFLYFYFFPFEGSERNATAVYVAYAMASVACLALAGLSYLTNWTPAESIHPKPDEKNLDAGSLELGLRETS